MTLRRLPLHIIFTYAARLAYVPVDALASPSVRAECRSMAIL